MYIFKYIISIRGTLVPLGPQSPWALGSGSTTIFFFYVGAPGPPGAPGPCALGSGSTNIHIYISYYILFICIYSTILFI